MMHGVISEKQWDGMRGSREAAERIRNKSRALLTQMSKVFSAEFQTDDVGMNIEPDEHGNAAISSPVGNGHARLEFCVVDQKLAGRLVFERIHANDKAENVLQAVWAIRIAQWGNPSMADGAGAPIRLDSAIGQDRMHDIFTAAMSALYAIAVGPTEATD